MLKKIAFYVFIAVSVTGAVWGYFHLKESKEPNASVLEHIPANAMCVIETKKCSELISQLTRQNLIWNSLLDNSSMAVAQSGITYLDSLINSIPEVADVISNNSVYWSFIKQAKTKEHLITFKVKEKNNEDLFIAFFEKVFKKDESLASFEAYYFTINKQKWLACYKGGIVYLCSDSGLLQDCLDLGKTESLASNKAYTDLVKINGEQTTQVYINHSLMHLFPKSLFVQQSLFGAEVQLNELTLTGYSNTDSSSVLNAVKNQTSESITGFEHLPNNPAVIQAVTLSDAALFYQSTQKLNGNELELKNNKAWITLNDSALYDIEKESLENIDGDVISATYFLDNANSYVLSVKVKDAEKTDQLLKLCSDSTLADTKICKVSEDYSKLFSFVLPDVKYEFACLHDNNLMFFSNNSVLAYYQQALLSSNLLGKNSSFMSYATDNLIQECNYLYYENTKLTKLSGINSLINSEELFSSQDATSQLSFTAKNYKNHIQVRMNISHEKEKTDVSETTSALWSFKADSVITSNSHVFLNHLTQENELCFQDENNDVYLISSTGKLLWKKNITEKIRSSIQTVDIFKNGKFQMLFNTENYLHLLDRNGNYVQGYPVKLPAKVTSNLTLLDYDKTKDYRLFLACADNRIYNFSIYGIKTEGFVPVKTDDIVVLPISYVKIGASDYLITADISGKIYGFSRKGEMRIELKNRVIENLEHLFVLPGNSLANTKLLYVDDKNNLLNKISLIDKKEALKIGDELNNFKSGFALINDDTQQDLIVYGNGAVYAYDFFTSKLIEYFNELAVYDDVQFVQTSDNDWLLAYDKTGQKIDVISTAGKLSTTLFNSSQKPLITNLYKNGKTYVLMINGNNISCQELK